jgi:RimJ/RimL family protein N-acetyltransferase
MGRVELETARLRLRPPTDADVDGLVALHSDPDVMRYLGPPGETAEHVRAVVLPYFLSFPAGFGYFVAQERATGAFLGWFLFRPPRERPVPGEIELGYRLHRAAWGRGFATEGSRALVDRGFTDLGVERVVAQAMAVNRGSRRVLEKVGLRHVRTVDVAFPEPLPGSEHGEAEYALTRAEWHAAGRGPSAATPP